jgi:hypothetical protein
MQGTTSHQDPLQQSSSAELQIVEICRVLGYHLAVMLIGRWKKMVVLLLELELCRGLVCVCSCIHIKVATGGVRRC